MATIKGVWTWNTSVNFTNSYSFLGLSYTSNNTTFNTLSVDVINGNTSIKYSDAPVYNNGWGEDAYRTIDFGTTEQECPDEFHTEFTANAEPYVEIEYGKLKVYSNGGSPLLKTFSIPTGETVSFTVASNGFSGGGYSYTYSGNKTFLGLATSANATTPTYAVGSTFSWTSTTAGKTVYIVETTAEPDTPTETKTIKAGTYRFNDVLTALTLEEDVLINFTSLNILTDTDNNSTSGMYAYTDGSSNSYIGFSTSESLFFFIDTSNTKQRVYWYSITPDTWEGVSTIELWEGYGADPKNLELLKEQYREITVIADTEVYGTFATWFEENTKPVMSTEDSIKAKIQSLIAKANTTTGKSDADLTKAVLSLVAGYGQGGTGGSTECSLNHIIEVEELPTDGIVQTNLYKMGGTYYRYAGEFKDLIAVTDGSAISFIDMYSQYGLTFELYYVETTPTENIMVTEPAGDAPWCLYYIEDINVVGIYTDVEGTGTISWASFAMLMEATDGGAITDISQATTENTMYALVDAGWKPLGAAEYTGEVVIE